MKNKKVLLTVLLSLLTIGVTAGLALAVPSDTVIVGGSAYSFEYFNSNPDAIFAVIEALDNGDPVYVKIADGVILNATSGELVDGSELPAVTYYDPDGNTTSYAAGDSEETTGPTMTATFNTITTVGSLVMGTVTIELEGLENADTFTVTYDLAGTQKTTAAVGVGEASGTVTQTETITVTVYDASGQVLSTFTDARYGVPAAGTGGGGSGDDFEVIDIQ
jgi:hypothetical protein